VFGTGSLSSTYSLLTQADLSLEAPPPTHRLSGSKMGSCFVIGQFNRNNYPDIVLGGAYGGLNSRGWAAVLNDVMSPMVITITGVTRGASGTGLEWTGMAGWLFTVEYRSNLTTSPAWKNLEGAIDLPGIAGSMSYTDTSPITNSRFYRIRGRK
jgi:hypothetical protein